MALPELPQIDAVSYAVESRLGSGGNGEVFRVRSVADDTVRALKRIRKSSDERRNERFRREIGFGLSAEHRNVIRIHAHAEDDGYFYYTMDLYSASLRDLIAHESDYGVLLDYLSQLCDGLSYVHALGVVHRDLKPENVLVDAETRRLVIADFGIAHFADSALTRRGDLLANRNYMAPEQMVKGRADQVGRPADVFALGLIMTELFTKQSARGVQHTRIGDVHPFLSDLDLLADRMMLQDATHRLAIAAVRDQVLLVRRHVDDRVADIADALRPRDPHEVEHIADPDSVLQRAARDVLSAAYIFERTRDEDLARYDANHHAEISWNASELLITSCVQTAIYSATRAKWEYEASGAWSGHDDALVQSPEKAGLMLELDAILEKFPLPHDSPWGHLPSWTRHYFRFCKDYHCRELVSHLRDIVSNTGVGSIRDNLVGAPILWIVRSARSYLASASPDAWEWARRELHVQESLLIDWTRTAPDDARLRALGADLLAPPRAEESVDHVLDAFTSAWNVSVGERVDGNYSIHFRSRDEYLRFRADALALAASHDVFEGDVLDLLRPIARYDDLVALVWEPTFDIRVTLARLLGLRAIR